MLLTSPVRVLALVATLATVGVTVALLITIDGDAWGMIQYQRRLGETPYAVGIGWVVLAPVLFVVGSAYVSVSTSPWVVLCTVHLVVLVAVSLEFREMMSVGYWVAATICGTAALASVVAAAAGTRRPGDF